MLIIHDVVCDCREVSSALRWRHDPEAEDSTTAESEQRAGSESATGRQQQEEEGKETIEKGPNKIGSNIHIEVHEFDSLWIVF